METKGPIPTEDILSELQFSSYISEGEELEEIEQACEKVLQIQAAGKAGQQAHERESTLGFIQALWGKYDCRQVADKFDNFVKIEEALFGLERDKRTGEWYRDHFVHMFSAFVFGLRFISRLFEKVTEDERKKIFKVEDENLKKVGLPFSENYTYSQRLFYLWMLIATFHDIAIPVQHMPKIGKGINRFVEEFGWMASESVLTMRNFDTAQLYRYFSLLSQIYDSKLEYINDGLQYKVQETPNSYVMKTLGRAFDRREHGAMSGFFMWKTIEEIFLLGLSEKYRDKIGPAEFNIYDKYVLQQDIARAALAISLHTLKKNHDTGHPKILPIDFADYPLTFLLILADELQEYHRQEGGTIVGNTKFRCQPKMDLECEGGKIRCKVPGKCILCSSLKS